MNIVNVFDVCLEVALLFAFFFTSSALRRACYPLSHLPSPLYTLLSINTTNEKQAKVRVKRCLYLPSQHHIASPTSEPCSRQ
ncbi:hypothetical protein EDB85DRAFT_1971847 [Lactarius pseudohatsudake]|nr:hypothetical protein EDB85DRAFT_1971847 [Lactarius pseudohatsudake]